MISGINGGSSSSIAVVDEGVRSQQRALQTAAAGYLGISVDDLRKQLATGLSLADIAQTSGKDVDGLKSTLLQTLRGSSAADAAAKVDRLVHARRRPHHHPSSGGRLLGATADFLGVSARDLQDKLSTGQTLDEIVHDAGKSPDALMRFLQQAMSRDGQQVSVLV